MLRRSPCPPVCGPLSLPSASVGSGAPVRPDEAQDWASASYRPGDVLVFHSLTVHWAPPNRGERLRLSCDYRYQLPLPRG